MNHLQQFKARQVLPLPAAKANGWQLKQYAILANGREFDNTIASAAQSAAFERLPEASTLTKSSDNHGAGFQIIHFAETAVVSPVFYWQWGSVLANVEQLRASWEAPTVFGNGVNEVVGCIWEMEVVCFEVNAWKSTLLNESGNPDEKLAAYLKQHHLLS